MRRSCLLQHVQTPTRASAHALCSGMAVVRYGGGACTHQSPVVELPLASWDDSENSLRRSDTVCTPRGRSGGSSAQGGVQHWRVGLRWLPALRRTV